MFLCFVCRLGKRKRQYKVGLFFHHVAFLCLSRFSDSYVVTLKAALCDPGAGVPVSLDSYDARARVPRGEKATSDGGRQSGINSSVQLLHSP